MRPGGVRKRTGKGSGYDPLDDLPMLAGLQTGRGALCYQVFRSFVCPSVRLSVRPSVTVNTWIRTLEHDILKRSEPRLMSTSTIGLRSNSTKR